MHRHRLRRSAMHTNEGAKTLCSGSYQLFNKTLSLRTNYNLVSFVDDEKGGKPKITLSQLGQIRGSAADCEEGQGSAIASEPRRTAPRSTLQRPMACQLALSRTRRVAAVRIVAGRYPDRRVPVGTPPEARGGSANRYCPNWDTRPSGGTIQRSTTCQTKAPSGFFLANTPSTGLLGRSSICHIRDANKINMLHAVEHRSVEHFVSRAPGHSVAKNLNALIFKEFMSRCHAGLAASEMRYFVRTDYLSTSCIVM